MDQLGADHDLAKRLRGSAQYMARLHVSHLLSFGTWVAHG